MKAMTLTQTTLAAAILLSLTACGGGGGGGGDSASNNPAPVNPAPVNPAPVNPAPVNPAPTNDACTNYEGLQTTLEVAQKHFERLADGTCKLKQNHDWLASAGLDVTRMMGLTGKGVTIAVVDRGMNLNHEEFVGRIDPRSGKYINGALAEGQVESVDEIMATTGHGTSMLSVAGGERTGAAPGAMLLALVSPQYPTHTIEQSVAALERGVNIINQSNDYFFKYDMVTSTSMSYSIQPHIKGTQAVYITAAGNAKEDWSKTFDEKYGTSQASFDDASFAPHVIVAGRASDLGTWLPSGTPGYRTAFQERFLSTGQDALSNTTASIRLDDKGALMNDYYSTNGPGTSSATAQVSGAIAVVMEANPRLSAVQAAQVLLDTADRPASLGYGTTCSGSTVKGAYTTDCGAMKYGRGLMNVPKAVKKAKAM